MNPSKHSITVLSQIFKLIPRNLIPRLAKEHGVSSKCRSFTPNSHVLALMYAQLSHSISLNDVCDSLQNHSGALISIREAVPPSRNGLSHANRERNAEMGEALFWEVLSDMIRRVPSFGFSGRQYCGLPRRFKRTINVVDSSTIALVANCMDWAQHRHRKAAFKMHLRLDLQTFLPKFVLVKAANTHDITEAYDVCAGLRAGEIVVFDKAYLGFGLLNSLNKRDVFWVTRAKDNMQYEVVGQHSEQKGNILQDVYIRLTNPKSSELYPHRLRLVEAMVDFDGNLRKMAFLTNNMKWAPSSICDLYRSRWGIEVFFKEIKQTLQIADFMGHNENAVRWQVWTALLVYILLRFISWQGRWKSSFTRLFTLLRAVLWSYFDIFSVISCCGTARGNTTLRAAPYQLYLPGFSTA